MPGRRQHGEGAFFQRTRDGKWVARTPGYRPRDPGSREFVRSDPKEALDARAEFLARRRVDGFTMPKGRQPYVSEWMAHWLYAIARPNVAATTFERSYQQKVTDLVIPFFARVPLGDLDETMVRAWHVRLLADISDRTGRPRSAATIGQAHRLLSMGMRAAEAERRIVRNPVANVQPPRADDRDRPEPPGEGDILAILGACEGRRSGPRWVTSLGTGLRQGEALGLLRPGIHVDDPDDAWIDVQWELARLKWRHGCEDPHACGFAGARDDTGHRYPCPVPCPKTGHGGHRHTCFLPGDKRCCPPGCEGHATRCPQRAGGGLRLKRPKSARSRRQIPLPRYVAVVLREWLKVRAAEHLASPAQDGWAHDPESCPARLRRGELVCPTCQLPARPGLLVFCRPDGRPVDPHADWEDWGELLEAAGVDYVRVHDGRHAYATGLLEDGEDVKVVQELMGHATSGFTRDTYQFVAPRVKRSAAVRQDRRMRGA